MDKGQTVVVSCHPVKPASAWGKMPTVAPCSLSSVIDEELAKKLQHEEEERSLFSEPQTIIFFIPVVPSSDPNTDNDLALAQMLQAEFDKENDRLLNIKEHKYNGNSKVSLSFDNYRSVHSILKDDSSSSDDQDDWVEDDLELPPPPITEPSPKPGGSGKNITTKHDAVVCGRRNAQNLEKFPPGFAAGDVGSKSLDLKLSNSVYNTLKQHSYQEERRSHRVHDKREHSTHEQALDPKTRLMLYKLVNNQTLEAVNGCISTGKEACVFHANGGKREDGEELPEECAVKVFKTTLNEFRTRERYIREDHRFRDRFSKQNPRKVVRLWAEKEMCNLCRMQKVGLSCPRVLLLKKHILVMSFIGKDQHAAPKLKNAMLTGSQLHLAYEQCIQMMCTMYQKARLVHADLSAYNMLWHEGRVWFIDVSQSVEPIHPHALEFLYRDCRNVVEFFKKKGVAGVMSAQQLFIKVSEADIPLSEDEGEFLAQVRSVRLVEM
ncbi:predicted protein [Nematostella vectensis]|uniref:Serine/threonine-protein kinase RIO3 n=1 Tax=Nematostella vectensis TaxID=45351 RepID=A7SCX7_NEMVE|nr:predicted protein [Nematostella vectensis]|eukprot:XP_001630481.1 predicted protein [Nematostella vectensis]